MRVSFEGRGQLPSASLRSADNSTVAKGTGEARPPAGAGGSDLQGRADEASHQGDAQGKRIDAVEEAGELDAEAAVGGDLTAGKARPPQELAVDPPPERAERIEIRERPDRQAGPGRQALEAAAGVAAVVGEAGIEA